jgi:Flp pilus assembly protein TadG
MSLVARRRMRGVRKGGALSFLARRSVSPSSGVAAGQSLAEMALVTPLLLLLLLGTIELGRFAYYAIEVSNAARAGVQYGAQSLADSTDLAGITQAARNDAPEITDLAVTTTNRCACSNTPADYVGCPARNCAPGHALVFLEVDTTARIKPLFRYPGLPSAFAAGGQAIMRVAQ